jgi:hypothetical protein
LVADPNVHPHVLVDVDLGTEPVAQIEADRDRRL